MLMRRITKLRKQRLCALAAAILATAWMPSVMAVPVTDELPTGEKVIKGGANISRDGIVKGKNQMSVNVNDTAVINWDTFNVGSGARVNFKGTDGFRVLNRVPNGPMSEIYGEIKGRGGTVFLINPSGVTFGEGAKIDVGSLVASTLNINDDNFINGKYLFEKGEKVGVIKNLANIGLSNDKKVVLLAHQVINEGKISAGQIGIGTGNEIELALDDKIGIKVNAGVDESADVNILNSGTLSANDGYVVMTAGEAKKALNGIIANSGVVAAKKITKDADGNIILADGGDIDISGYSIWNSGEIRANGGYIKDNKAVKGGNGGHVSIEGNSIVTEKLVAAIGRLSYDEVLPVTADKVADGGSISLTGEKLILAGSVKADGPVNGGVINTIGTKDLLVAGNKKLKKDSSSYFKTASIHAAGENGQAGTWNIESANVNISHDVITTDSGNVVNNRVITSSLKTTNVNVVAKLGSPTDFADIKVANKIKKEDGTDTSLTMTAGRNISVDADITSTAGKLNLTLNSNNKLDGKSERIDGASIIRANINTNGGDFTTTGMNGTYLGLKDSEKAGKDRTVETNGGNITLNGDVLLATGGKVTLDTTAADGKSAGDVTITGTVDSGNKYTIGRTSAKIPWDNKSGALHNVTLQGSKESAEEQGGYLAVITSGLEDAVVNSVAPTEAESHIGGHVVAMPEGVNCTVDENGNINLTGLTADGKIPEGKLQLIYTDTAYGKNSYNVRAENGNRGWYKVNDNTLVRLWAWVTGPEAGKVFYVQAIQSAQGTSIEPTQANYKQLKHFGKAYGYTNFLANEPNDDLIQIHTQNCLAINYHSQWDDIYEDIHDNNDLIKTYVVETELGKTSLDIKGNKVDLQGNVGSITKLNDLTVNANADIKANGSVQVDGNLSATAVNSLLLAQAAEAGKDVSLFAGTGADKAIAGRDVNVNAITGKTISITADNDVTINGTLKAEAESNQQAVVIRAQGNFHNNTAVPVTPLRLFRLNAVTSEQRSAIQVSSGSAWKIYSDKPSDDLGNLDSGNFAEWGWDGTSTSAATGNRFVFKYNPTLTFTANDASKQVGEVLTDTGYTFNNELSGRYTNNFRDGFDDSLLAEYGLNNVGTQSPGFPANAAAGTYKIDFTNLQTTARDHGYILDAKPGTLTVIGIEPGPTPPPTEPEGDTNPGDVKPQLDPHNTTNVDGSASYTTAARSVPGVDRVLGLQSAELPFFREEGGQVKSYGTYNVSIDPDKVKMEPMAKLLPEPVQPKNQYREYEKELTTPTGVAKFMLTYNGSTFDIYPVDGSAKDMLIAGDVTKNVDVESQALFAAFKEMGITLDDLDGVYTHFSKKSDHSFRN